MTSAKEEGEKKKRKKKKKKKKIQHDTIWEWGYNICSAFRGAEFSTLRSLLDLENCMYIPCTLRLGKGMLDQHSNIN